MAWAPGIVGERWDRTAVGGEGVRGLDSNAGPGAAQAPYIDEARPWASGDGQGSQSQVLLPCQQGGLGPIGKAREMGWAKCCSVFVVQGKGWLSNATCIGGG
ncbi:hypothetical protein MFU01_22230 [Myxococcus fulvus]|uniref:Uncharacterized protein n=1 Tax=Myxococcus fulvus TaxID=33 RepID=A0A511SZ68_MYXFU|nr:hypothetical protein MFU01_22230 [Myxococcus fulvus]